MGQSHVCITHKDWAGRAQARAARDCCILGSTTSWRPVIRSLVASTWCPVIRSLVASTWRPVIRGLVAPTWGQLQPELRLPSTAGPVDDSCHVQILCWPESFLLGLRDGLCTETRKCSSLGSWVACGRDCQQEAGGVSRLGLDQFPKWKKRPLCTQTAATQPPSGGGQRGQMAS